MGTVVVVGIAVLLGLAAGFLLAFRWKTVEPATAPFLRLAKTLRPLLLPLIAVAVVGVFQYPFYVFVPVTTALAFLAMRLIVMPEARKSGVELKWEPALRRKVARHSYRILAAAIPAALLILAVGSTRYFDEVGGPPAFLLVLALLLWLVAFLLRLTSYASSWMRVAVAVAIVLAGLCGLIWVGLLPGGDWLDEEASWLPSALLGLALSLLAVEACLGVAAAWRERRARQGLEPAAALETGLKVREEALPPRAIRVTAGLGVSFALLAATAIAISALWGLAETAQPGEKLTIDSATTAKDAAEPPPPPSADRKLALARAYAPVLALTRNEPWSPIAVESYVEDAILLGPIGAPLADPPSAGEKLNRRCPAVSSSPCFTLTIRCESGEEECAGANPHPDRANDRLYREGAVYYRVVERSEERALEAEREAAGLRPSNRWPPPVFVDEGRFRRELETLIQYWYFYYYDDWRAEAFAGELVQRHEGDWEAVTIGLSATEPLFVAYSSHCAGTWRTWEGVELYENLPQPTHPLVAVAEGSHANYPEASQRRAPDWAHCQGIPEGSTTLLSYASNIRDKTEYGWLWYPADDGWRPADVERVPMSFPGYWGKDDEATLNSFFASHRLGGGKGPKTPSQQPLWESPLRKIFCGNYTGPEGDDECEEK